MGVHDDHLGFGRPPVGGLGEALVALRALQGARALACRHAEHPPRPGPRLEVELGPVAAAARLGPLDEPYQLLAERTELVLAHVFEHELVVALADLGRLLEAEVVGSALEHGEREGLAEVLGKEGQVLGGELVLQGLGDGRHDRRAPREDGGHQVREALSNAGARLHDELTSPLEDAIHGLGHLPLAGPGLPAPGKGGDDPLQRLRHAHAATVPRRV